MTWDMINVKNSSNVASIGWKENKLRVVFLSGQKYEYINVTEEKFLELANAESKGSYLIRKIFPNHIAKRLQDYYAKKINT